MTASNHGNASQLNARRVGKLHLFSSQPPIWSSRLKPPKHQRSWFDYGVPASLIKDHVASLCALLLRLEELGLSPRGPKWSRKIEEHVERIIDQVFFRAGKVQALPSGWTDCSEIKLKIEQQLFLDPYRQDELFQQQRKSSDWQAVVCEDFASWLNKRLSKSSNRKFTAQDDDRKRWAECMETELREYNLTLDHVVENDRNLAGKKI